MEADNMVVDLLRRFVKAYNEPDPMTFPHQPIPGTCEEKIGKLVAEAETVLASLDIKTA